MNDKIRDLFAVLLRVSPDDLRDETEPADLARWDSMQHLILVAGFEEEFGVDVAPEETVDMYKNFGAFKKVILQKLESSR